MEFKIENEIFDKYPDVNIGIIIAKNMNNSGEYSEIQGKIRETEEIIKKTYTLETLSTSPKIRIWREVYTSFGAKPKKYKSSIENLYQLVLSGIELRRINPLVDIYNLISLKYTLPVGGEDLDKIVGDLVLTFASENEKPIILLGDTEEKSPHKNEVIYKDDNGAVCRRWNWREADRTKLTGKTKNAILVIEGIGEKSKEDIAPALSELKNLVSDYCGGELSSYLLNKNNPSIKIKEYL